MENMNEVKISAPELVEAVRALTEVLGQLCKSNILKEVKSTDLQNEEKSEQARKDQEVITLETVRAKLAEISKAGKFEQVKALIAKFGGNKLTDISADKYGDILKEVGRW